MKVKIEGLGLPVILFLIFMILKLTGHITWSWFWVFSPIIFTTGFVLFIILIIIVFAVLAVLFGAEPKFKWRKR